MQILGVIPARLGSTRLPRKPLQLLGGVPLVVRVMEHVRLFELVDRLVVATDASEVAEVVAARGVEVVMTGPCQTGTERVRAVACAPSFAPYPVVINFQGDEPFLPREAAEGALRQVVQCGNDVGTAAVPLLNGDMGDRNRVKVEVTPEGRAQSFFRDERAGSTERLWQHLGIYAYTREALARWVDAQPDPQELGEGLEQLRAMALGLSIGVATLASVHSRAVDTVADLSRAEAHWRMALEATS